MSKRPSRSTGSTVPKLISSNPTRSTVTVPERSQSEYPTLTEAMNRVSLGGSESTSGARSQTTRPSYQRRILYSAVPDSAVLTPIHRPDEYGKAGKSTQIYTNHFRVSIDDAIVNQYDIEISMVRRDGKLCSARKNERWQTLQELSKKEKNFPIVWYDEGKNLYTRELLTDFTKPIRITLKINNEDKIFEFKVLNLVRQEKIRDIFDFINGRTVTRPRDPVRVIETLFKQSIRNDLVCIRNKFYSRRQKLIDLGDGRGMASGFHQALCLTHGGPTLNINLAFTCFYLPLNFVDFSCKYLRKDITQRITETEIEGIKRLFKNLPIETTHTGRPLRYRVKGFGKSANELTFNLHSDKDQTTATTLEKSISVAEYFSIKYKRLEYPHLPCVDARNSNEEKAHWLPMEVVKIVEWERALRPLDSVQRALVSKTTIIKPDKRYDDIMKIVRQRNFQSDSYLRALNIKVDTNEMIQIKARILPTPEVKYRGPKNNEVAEDVAVGKWSIRNRFYNSPMINQWGMIYFGPKLDKYIIDILTDFQNQLPQLTAEFGVIFTSKPKTIAQPPRSEEIEVAMKRASNEKWQIAIVVLNDVQPEVYECIKQWGNQTLGVTTQCVNFQSLQRNSGKYRMYVQNLSQKINAKIGGINGIVNLKAALSHSSHEDLFMFFGADVTHTTCSIDHSSIAAVVGSCDPTCSRYVARLSEQYPKQGRCSVEIIKELDKMIIDLLKVFIRTCGNRLPNRIVFYRDGVDDGQFQKVLDNEINKIKDACRVVYGKLQLPRLTFVIAKRGHNTRFFAYDGQRTSNIEAGTVIDQDITHPSQFDFYLCSQAAIMGTSRPTLYHVLHDENGFSSDDIQQLTYWLCHTDARCTKSVSVPAPIHYADLAAHAARMYKFGDDLDRHEENDDDFDESENISLKDIETKVMILNDKIQNNMCSLLSCDMNEQLSRLNDISYSKDGRYFVVGQGNGYINIYEAQTDRDGTDTNVQRINFHAMCYRLLIHENVLFTATSDLELKVYSFPQANAEQVFMKFNHLVSARCASNGLLFIGTRNAEVVMINLNDGSKEKKEFHGHEDAILWLSINDDEKLLATSSIDGRVRVYSIDQQMLIKSFNVINKSNDIESAQSLARIDWDTIENLPAIPVKNRIYFYEIKYWELKKMFEDNTVEEFIDLIDYSPCKNFFIITYRRLKLVIINRKTLNVCMNYSSNNTISSLAWNPTGSSMITCGTKEGVIINLHITSRSVEQRSFKNLININRDLVDEKFIFLTIYALFFLSCNNINLFHDQDFKLNSFVDLRKTRKELKEKFKPIKTFINTNQVASNDDSQVILVDDKHIPVPEHEANLLHSQEPFNGLNQLPDAVLDRFCLEILPKIHHKIEWLDVESSSIERILLLTNYSNLNGLRLYDLTSERARDFFTDDNVQLLDLPDELILIIMNKVKSNVLLLCSIIDIGNNRLEQLALDKCHSIDLTIDYFQSPFESLMTRFYSHVMYRIINNIQSLTLTIRQIPDIVSYVEKNSNGILPNLTHLKIMIGRQAHRTGTPYTLDASSKLLSIF
ncbi:unnamed protein product [Rotaria sordida]|uniref:Uncharacterized protein n=1 Tax=Rotaria sordida TaxID=392033 RepID=A0A814MGI8_9BILA|nr:unnamed protein product [Rotaria sordida]